MIKYCKNNDIEGLVTLIAEDTPLYIINETLTEFEELKLLKYLKEQCKSDKLKIGDIIEKNSNIRTGK